ncbi:autotransporter adhesin, partial [Paraburkholderia bannensis]
MNKAYRSVWNESTQTWVAAQENAMGRGKRSSSKAVVALNAAVLLGVGALAASEANAGTVSDGTNAVISDSFSGTCAGAPSATETTNGGSSFAMGCAAYAYGNNVMAFGSQATASGSGATAFGSNTRALNSGAVAFGVQSLASGTFSAVVGSWSSATGNYSTALGQWAKSSANAAVAIGYQAVASASNGIAIGSSAAASTANSVALGNNAVTGTAVNVSSGVIGGTTYNYAGATPTGVVSVGSAGQEHQITNVAAGQVTALSTDAVNGSQLYATNTQVTTNASNITTLQGQVTTLQGNVTTLQGNVTTLQGNVTTLQSQVTTLQGNVTTMNGQITNIQGKLADAVLYDSSSHNSVTLGGSGASAPVGLHNVANGQLNATSTDAVNGSQLYATNTNVSNLAGSVTNLAGNVTSMQGDITNINGKLNDAVLYDSSSHNSVTLGGSGASAPVGLHNVANGQLNATSTDAVNGSQLYATNTNVSNLAGSVTNLAGNVTTINGQITNMQGQLADAVLYDSSSHNSVTLGGSGASAPVGLHNVANGQLTATSTDAVNGSQLYATNTTVSNLAGSVTNLA